MEPWPWFKYWGPKGSPLAKGAYPNRCKHCNGLGEFRWWDADFQNSKAECRYCLEQDLHPLTMEPVQRNGLPEDFEWEPPLKVVEANVPAGLVYLYEPHTTFNIHYMWIEGEYYWSGKAGRFTW